jgi:tripartite ATP-independent transporter DctM subunit
MSIELIAILMFASMAMLLLTGRHIFVAIGSIGIIFALTLWGKGGFDMAFFSAFTFMKWYPLLAIPPFVFMGLILAKSGMADAMYEMIYRWIGRIHGGLAMGTIGISATIALMVGGATAGTVTAGVVAMPSMLKRKYNKVMVTGVVQAGGALGFLIPPSIIFILYGVIARVSIGHLFLAGVIPGFLLAAMYIAYIYIRCRRNPSLGPPAPERFTMADKLASVRAGIAPVAIVFLVLGLFFMGVTTVMESAAVGAVSAIAAAAIYGKLNKQVIRDAMDDGLKISCLFLWILTAAFLFAAVFDGLGGAKVIEPFFSRLGSPWMILIMMQLSFIGMGTFLDDTAMLLIVAPIYLPMIRALGFDPVWYGVLYVITCEMAYLTPPFGYTLFIMKGLVRMKGLKEYGITLGDIYRSVIPFVGIQAALLGLVMLFPALALWLPSMIFSGTYQPM